MSCPENTHDTHDRRDPHDPPHTQDPVLKDLLAELDVLILEPPGPREEPSAGYRILGRAPAWAAAFLPAAGSGIHPAELFPFLESFLADAECHWAAADGEERLRSEVWTEVGSDGAEYHLGASALRVAGRRLLVVTRAEVEFSRLHTALQGARDNLLRHDREMSRAERERTRLTAERERAITASDNKSRFLSQMGHELRSPLTAILGYAELLKEEAESAGDAVATADLKRIEAAGRHLVALIGEVLDMSKAEAGRLSLNLETFDVRAMLDDVLATAAPLADTNGNVLKLEVAPAVTRMRADRLRLSQCLLNLLSNAAKFTRRGTITLFADREIERERGDGERGERDSGTEGTEAERKAGGGDWSCFTVTDTGIGMTAEQIERLFQPFVQADRNTQKEYGGTGLGLAISRQLCRLMGGDVTAHGVPGKGAAFTIRVPTEVSLPPDAMDACAPCPPTSG